MRQSTAMLGQAGGGSQLPLESRPDVLLSAADSEAIVYADEQARRDVAPLLNGQAGRVQWRLVKRNASRSVYRGQTDAGSVYYLKQFHGRSLSHLLRRRLGLWPARTELNYSQYLRNCQVPVLRVLAACWGNGADWLITADAEPFVPADAWHARQLEQGDTAAIRQASVALAGLIGRMHACGVLHRDLHCGNVLVRPDQPADVMITDLHRMGRRRSLSRRQRAWNLAQLLSGRLIWTTRCERLRFLRHYLAASAAEGSLRGWARLVEPMARRMRRRVCRHNDRRIIGSNGYFARLSAGGYDAHVLLGARLHVPHSKLHSLRLTAADWQQALSDPEKLFTGEGVEVIRNSPSRLLVRRKLKVGPAELDVYIKRLRRGGIRLLELLRPCRAVRAFRLGHALLNRHILTTLPLAAMARRRGRLPADSILISEAADPAMHLNKFLNRYLGKGDDLGGAARSHLAQQVLWQLGRLVRRLYEEGFAHRDLKAGNLLVDWDGDSAHCPKLLLADLDAVRRVGHVTVRQEFRGLMRLNVSLLDCPVVNKAGRLRMLLGYLRWPGGGQINYKPYWRVLEEWSAATIRRNIAARQRRQKAQRRAGT